MPALADPPSRKSRFQAPRIPDHRDLSGGSAADPPGAADPHAAETEPWEPHLRRERNLAPTLEDILSDYLMADLPLIALARRHRLSFEAFTEILDSPAFKKMAADHSRLSTQRAHDVALSARATALAKLESVKGTTCLEEPARKSSNTLIRASDRILYPAPAPRDRAISPAAEPDSPQTAHPSSSAPVPQCAVEAATTPAPAPTPAFEAAATSMPAAPHGSAQAANHHPPENGKVFAPGRRAGASRASP